MNYEIFKNSFKGNTVYWTNMASIDRPLPKIKKDTIFKYKKNIR